MKGEYLDPKNYETPNMFSKLHHHNQNQNQNQNPNPNPNPHHLHHQHNSPFPNPFQISARECQTPDDENTSSHTSSGPGSQPNSTPQLLTTKPASDPTNPPSDGATIEVSRRPRGRPPGSKNKPKPTVFITRHDTNEKAMNPYILEIPTGNDVVEALTQFCQKKNLGLCVLTASGTVANVTLRQPSTTPGATVTFHGRFDIISICATFMPQTTPSCPVPNGFTISLAGPQGQIVGGLVAGPLVAAGTVYLIAASFNNPSYHRLPLEEDLRNSASGEGQSPPASGGGESSGHAPAESCGMSSMYSCHNLPSDVIWAPTARQPPPPY